jgi:hypothetical protein
VDATDNKTTLQAMIDAQYALLETEQTLYASLQAQRAALPTPDVGSLSDSREGGSGAFQYVTLTEQLTQCAGRLRELNAELLDLFKLKNQRFPWNVYPRPRHWGGCL